MRCACLVWAPSSVVLLIFLLPMARFARPQQKPGKRQSPRAAPWHPEPQEEFVPYWTLEPGWDTALEMRSNVPGHDIVVTPALQVAGGAEFPLEAGDAGAEPIRLN
jgi:hypothetical protein